jgi:hypothetical protein
MCGGCGGCGDGLMGSHVEITGKEFGWFLAIFCLSVNTKPREFVYYGAPTYGNTHPRLLPPADVRS